MNRFSMHDFRMVRGSTRTNLIFDVEVPRKTSYTDNEIVNWLKERIHELRGVNISLSFRLIMNTIKILMTIQKVLV